MGFYGNITNTSKTTFSFDEIYETRTEMDENANTDGVFLGRYVLVNQDEAPIKAYYDKGLVYSADIKQVRCKDARSALAIAKHYVEENSFN